MREERRGLQTMRGVAFLGNYLPRKCGIATFTHDLATAIQRQIAPRPVVVAAMNDADQEYAYPDAVALEIREDYLQDYENAANYFNFSDVDVVSVQHEYGIYGGEWGSHVLAFMKRLKKPSVVTCHTVFEKPDDARRKLLVEIAAYASKLVVMSERAVHFLTDAYGIPKEKIACIPHGIHDTPFIDPNYFKDKFGVEGQRVLLTFGLIRREKGIEYVIKALPRIVEKHPNTVYIVLGATHPALVRAEGESYRLGLQRLARELGVERHVRFYAHFVDLEGLLEYIGAADIFVTPYLYQEQITSGALSYAMGAGKAVVSTPYWHAEELMADDCGILVPPGDENAIAEAVVGLLSDEPRMAAMRKRAYLRCRDMVWSAVAAKYVQLFDAVRSQGPTHYPVSPDPSVDISATQLPVPSLEHVVRMCDDTGPARYARFCIPDRRFGYRLEDACGALVAAISHYRKYHDAQALSVAETCLALIQTLTQQGGFSEIRTGLSYDRQPQEKAAPDSAAQVIWALGYVIARGPNHLADFAQDLFHQVLPEPEGEASLRMATYVTLGTHAYLGRFPGATFVRRVFAHYFAALRTGLEQSDWVERFGHGDWPMAAYAYARVARTSDDSRPEAMAALVDTLLQRTDGGTRFDAVGDNPIREELSVTAGAFVSAMTHVYRVLPEERVLRSIRAAMDWFLGRNALSVPIYDFTTHGCYDAISTSGLNKNQSTAATVFFLRGLLATLELEAPQFTTAAEASVR